MRLRTGIMFVMILTFQNLSAQRCQFKEDINPATDSLCWTINTKSGVNFIVDKSASKKMYIYLQVIMPTGISSSIGDSARIVLEDGNVIWLTNLVNFQKQNDKLTALVVEMRYGYARLVSEVTSEIINCMVSTRISRVSLFLHTFPHSNWELSNKPTKHPFAPEIMIYNPIDGKLEISTDKFGPTRQKKVVKAANCISKHTR